MRAVVLIRVPARLTISARFFGSVSVGLWMRERQLSSISIDGCPGTVRRVDFCRLAAMMQSSYRGLRMGINRGLGMVVGPRPPRPVEHADEPRPRPAPALVPDDLCVDA